jgi:hypothetical protein
VCSKCKKKKINKIKETMNEKTKPKINLMLSHVNHTFLVEVGLRAQNAI